MSYRKLSCALPSFWLVLRTFGLSSFFFLFEVFSTARILRFSWIQTSWKKKSSCLRLRLTNVKRKNRSPKGDDNDPEMLKRSRKWVITINNYNDEDISKFDNLECRYSMRSLEKGENGTPHIQGYVELHAAVTRKALSKRLPRACLSKAYGTRDENAVYISKNENPTFLEKGTPGAQGKRWDLDKVRNTAIYDGMKQVVTDFGFQAIRVAQLYLEYNEPCRKVKPHVA